jgi:hypothetical protein
MRSLLVAAALLAFVPTQAGATSWYWVGGNEKTQSYVDLDSLRSIGSKIVVVTKSVYSAPINDDIYATAIRSEYDCAGGYFRTLEYSYFGYSGNLIDTEPSQTINEHKVPAKDSINESIQDFVCYRKGGTLVGDPLADARTRF